MSISANVMLKVDRLLFFCIENIADPTKGAKQRTNAKMQLDQVISELSKANFNKGHLDGLQLTAGLKWETAVKSNSYKNLLWAYCYLRLSMAKASQLVEVVWENKLNETVKKLGFTKAEILAKFTQKLSNRIQDICSKISDIEEKRCFR